MKTQQEGTIQFSGYPLTIIETKPTVKNTELAVLKFQQSREFPPSKNSIANDPKNWDVDWFNSYE